MFTAQNYFLVAVTLVSFINSGALTDPPEGVTTIEFGIKLISLEEYDVQHTRLSLTCWRRMKWVDERLKHKETVKIMKPGQIWKPKLEVWNSAKYEECEEMETQVFENGQVVSSDFCKLHPRCPLSNKWPLEEQTCEIDVSTWWGNEKHLNVFPSEGLFEFEVGFGSTINRYDPILLPVEPWYEKATWKGPLGIHNYVKLFIPMRLDENYVCKLYILQPMFIIYMIIIMQFVGFIDREWDGGCRIVTSFFLVTYITIYVTLTKEFNTGESYTIQFLETSFMVGCGASIVYLLSSGAQDSDYKIPSVLILMGELLLFTFNIGFVVYNEVHIWILIEITGHPIVRFIRLFSAIVGMLSIIRVAMKIYAYFCGSEDDFKREFQHFHWKRDKENVMKTEYADKPLLS